jgi:hypothetical protein
MPSDAFLSAPPVRVSARLRWDRLAGFALPVLLAAAFTLRAGTLLTQLYVVFCDETFQYFEQAHRLAFGTGVLPWEFIDGIRSWLLPGLLAGLMRITALLSDDPMLPVDIARLGCAALSLTVVFVGFRLGRAREGMTGALLAGGLCALWFDLVFFAPTVMTEVLAAHLGLLALWLGEPTTTPRRLFAAGLCFGLAGCLRYQYGPALLAAALVQHRQDWGRWRWLLAGAAAVVLPVGGVLDTVTWGTPFQSVWLNLLRNSVQGVSGSMGTEPVWFYGSYLSFALWPAPALLFLAVLGAPRAPAFAVAAAVTLLLHAAIPHKEVRFIYLTLAILPILIALGAAHLMRRVAERRGPAALAWGVPALLALGAAASWHDATTAPLNARWQFDRANTQVFLAAHDVPNLCGLAVKDTGVFVSGGYTYLHRDVPLYYQAFQPVLHGPGLKVPLRVAVMRHGQSIPQPPTLDLDAETARYNAVIAYAGHAPSGYVRSSCFDDVAREGRPPICLFTRPGGCSS